MCTKEKHGENINIAFAAPRPVSVSALHGGKKELLEAHRQAGALSNFDHGTGANDPHFHKHNVIGGC